MSEGELPRQFAGGVGNLNYLLELDGRSVVLRRPPLGPIPPGANDMAREHRILDQLWQVFPLAPQSLHYCPNDAVLGAHFLIMEYRSGVVIGSTIPETLTQDPRIGSGLADMMLRVLADLHQVDPADVGLADFGRPDGFLARAIEGWAKRVAVATDDNPPAVATALTTWLRDSLVPEQAPTLLHNDFKLDNVVLDATSLAPVAVLDWDMGSRGDPLFDLATLLSYWTEADDPAAMHDLGQMPTAAHGFPTRSEVVTRYAALTGRDVSNILFYRVLTMFKLGVVFLQLHARHRRGATTDARFADFGRLADGLLDFAHDVARGHAF